MPANPTPTNDSKLQARCNDLVGGCKALGDELGLKQNTAPAVQASLDAASDAHAEVGRLKKERSDRRAAFRKADKEGKKVIGRCRLRLAAIFGNAHSVQWEAAGFRGRSTMVPEAQAKRLVLLSSLAAFLAGTPAHESTDMGATEAICQAAHDALQGARTGVSHAGVLLRGAVREKNKALTALRRRYRGLIRELWVLLPADDPRWKRFGLNIPARISMPRPVKKVTLTTLGNGNVHVRWPRSQHTTRYRVQVRLPGAAEFESIATVHEPEALLRGLPRGQTVEVRVIAANALDEAAPSPVALATVAP